MSVPSFVISPEEEYEREKEKEKKEKARRKKEFEKNKAHGIGISLDNSVENVNEVVEEKEKNTATKEVEHAPDIPEEYKNREPIKIGFNSNTTAHSNKSTFDNDTTSINDAIPVITPQKSEEKVSSGSYEHLFNTDNDKYDDIDKSEKIDDSENTDQSKKIDDSENADTSEKIDKFKKNETLDADNILSYNPDNKNDIENDLKSNIIPSRREYKTAHVFKDKEEETMHGMKLKNEDSGISLVDADPNLKNTSMIKNPLPLPKPHVTRELSYDYDLSDDQLEFDINDLKGKDYYDI